MICFIWSGFPQYAARCVGAFVAHSKEKCIVVATRPKVPVEGMEQLCGCKVIWIGPECKETLRNLVGELPNIAIIDGWGVPVFNRFRDEVLDCGGRTYAMVDNNFIFSAKEILKALRFRLFLRCKYSAYLVPGNSGIRLLRFYGVGKRKVFKGMYAADAALFKSMAHLADREKRILFVGQFCDRKNVLSLVKAFLQVPEDVRLGWTLELCGCGPQKDMIPKDSAVIVHDFVQPEMLAAIYQNARVFCLPSREEHWGLVVHEAALSGCYLLLSRQVGAALDFIGSHNGVLFDADNMDELVKSIVWAMKLTREQLSLAERESLEKSKMASISQFVDSCCDMIEN